MNKDYILAYHNPETGENVWNRILNVDVDRAVEALKGQGIKQLGVWHLTDWAGWGKPTMERWGSKEEV